MLNRGYLTQTNMLTLKMKLTVISPSNSPVVILPVQLQIQKICFTLGYKILILIHWKNLHTMNCNPKQVFVHGKPSEAKFYQQSLNQVQCQKSKHVWVVITRPNFSVSAVVQYHFIVMPVIRVITSQQTSFMLLKGGRWVTSYKLHVIILSYDIVIPLHHQNGHFVPFVFPDMQIDVLPHHICPTKHDVPICVLDEYG